MKVGFVHLGCSKNLVDTEAIIGKFKENKYQIVNNPEEAEIIVTNTCGFIEQAKQEAINTILEMAEYKKQKCKYLVAIGCLVQRYYNELIPALPEVDLFIRIDEYPRFWEKIDKLIKKDEVERTEFKPIKKVSQITEIPMLTQKEYKERVITTGKNYAYIKIGEGCSNMCTYCAIPYIRGKFVSRKKEEIVEEAQELAKRGIKEIIIIAQDTTKYGVDIYGKPMLVELLQELGKIEKIKWIRFLYSYPEGITEELIQEVKNNKKICKYFDIPIQHISNEILKKMNRKTTKQEIERLINKIHKEVPNVTLRTSLIVGFPGETEEQFNELKEFIKKVKFNKLGTFMYSKEEGTPASRMDSQIHGNTKKARYKKIMQEQQRISHQKLLEKKDKECEVLIETTTFDEKYLVGRTSQDVPEIDGLVYIKNTKEQGNLINKFIKCKIVDVKDYDLIATII